MTPLAHIIANRIRATGPITLADYMQICLLDSRHGYYATRDPFGQAGDFITAPEIHQMFGEFCGLALAQAWMDQGRPVPFTLAEPGPGRGTLMADMLRAIRLVPDMQDAADVTLIEASPFLLQVQKDRLGTVSHIETLEDIPDKPLFLIANEFIDALPIRQFQRTEDGWRERLVGLSDNGELQMGLGTVVELPRDGKIGDVVEDCAEGVASIEVIARQIVRNGGAAIVIDYGGWNGFGDSFQALRNHIPEDPLANPGLADLTAHVDFALLAAAALRAGACVSRPIHQGDWLLSLGARERAQKLAANGDQGAMAALARLTSASEMGHLFKAIAIWPKGATAVPGFEALETYANDT
ncbi:class I SAM-dependent methyltransferase [Paracoccus sp. JM45]|uniref:class I SAM-dependent methyltransferase n=1 Tax=Paracoccus sp. JM45 TaxID=2283626 RepID=UPI000E6BEF20|nr:SAM-dependent methyltransferase [Paracoccus sp. JM45]RJE79772.1 class I SAM-dependent methyltransferase [Paracoccus sp. JM45]